MTKRLLASCLLFGAVWVGNVPAQEPVLPKRAGELNAEVNRLYQQGRYSEAVSKAREVLAILEKALGPAHPDVAATLENYAALLRKTGRESEAAPLEARAQAIRAKRRPQAPSN